MQDRRTCKQEPRSTTPCLLLQLEHQSVVLLCERLLIQVLLPRQEPQQMPRNIFQKVHRATDPVLFCDLYKLFSSAVTSVRVRAFMMFTSGAFFPVTQIDQTRTTSKVSITSLSEPVKKLLPDKTRRRTTRHNRARQQAPAAAACRKHQLFRR